MQGDAMHIVVCVKQIFDAIKMTIESEARGFTYSDAPSGQINPLDKNALETAVQLKERHGGTITALSLGAAHSKAVLQECIARGADSAVLIHDLDFAGADTLVTSCILAAAIRKISPVDIVICGRQAMDGDTAQVGPQIAELLGIPQVTCVARIEIESGTVRIERHHDDGDEIIGAKLPLLITVADSITIPGSPSAAKMAAARQAEIFVWAASGLKLDGQPIGGSEAAMKVCNIVAVPQRPPGVIIHKDTAVESVNDLMDRLYRGKIVW